MVLFEVRFSVSGCLDASRQLARDGRRPPQFELRRKNEPRLACVLRIVLLLDKVALRSAQNVVRAGMHVESGPVGLIDLNSRYVGAASGKAVLRSLVCRCLRNR